MSYPLEYDYQYRRIAADAAADVRAAFVRRTYGHLAGAVLAFAVLEALLLQIPGIEELVRGMTGNRLSWLLVLGAFIGVSWLAESWARSSTSLAVQYAGLGLFVVAEAVIFLPLLYVAATFYPGAIQTAGVLTLAMFAGLTLVVFITRQDFSFLRSFLVVGSLLAFGFIVAAALIGFSLGLIFCVAVVALACGYILYDTSNILHHYRTDQHVAAALALFASVALLFWYVLRIVMSSRR
jgi:FtsH-binding integral membrane protein